jgi:hypothetical protein
MFTHIYILTYFSPIGAIGGLSGCDIMTDIGVNIAKFKLAVFASFINGLQVIRRV